MRLSDILSGFAPIDPAAGAIEIARTPDASQAFMMGTALALQFLFASATGSAVSATIGVEQNRPMLTPGVANFASSAATARSQVATSWQPAAVAVACTAAMNGFGDFRIACIMFAHVSIAVR